MTIYFAEPLKQELDITVYYEEDDHNYNESYTSKVIVDKGETKADIGIDKTIKMCRIYIGTKINEVFSLDSIILNDHSLMLNNFKICMTVILFILNIVFLLLICLTNLKIEIKLTAIIFFTGLLYMVVITPLSVPDEPHHYQSAYQLSNYLTFNFDNLDSGNSAYFDYDDLSEHKNTRIAYKKVISEVSLPSKSESLIEIPYPRNLSYFICHLPQAIGISLARFTNQNFIVTFYLGRFINLKILNLQHEIHL